MPQTYTDEQRVAALAALEARGGSLVLASADTGMPQATLRDMSIASAPEAVRSTIKGSAHAVDYAALWGRAVELGAQIIARQLARYADMDLTPSQTRDVAVIAGIASDKHLDYRDGRKGAVTLDNSQHLTLPAGSTLDDVRALRDSLRAAQALDAAHSEAALGEGEGAASLT